jgi:VWFA-related protein
MRKLTATLLIALYAATANAQLEQLVESIEVRVTNIDVVVLDRAGHPVTGLTKDDFEIYEDGKLKPLSNFYEVRESVETRGKSDATTAATAEVAAMRDPRPRRVIFFIDNYSMHPAKRAEVIRSIQKFFNRLLVPGDEAAIVTWNRNLKMIRSFTGDLDLLEASLAELGKSSSGGMSMDNEVDRMKSRCLNILDDARTMGIKGPGIPRAHEECLSMATAQAEDLFNVERSLTSAIDTMLATLAGVEGKKVMVFAGAHLPDHPGLDIFQWVDDTFQPYIKDMQPSTFTMRGRRVLTSSLDNVGRHANANGITLYMIDAADNMKGFIPNAESSTEAVDVSSSFTSYASTLTAFAAVAGSTGGMALTRANGFDLALDTLARDLNSYYSLGFKPEARQQEGERSIEVKCKRPGVTVRARRSYRSKSPQDTMSDRVVANLFHRSSTSSDLNVSLKTGGMKRQGKAWLVPISVSLPASDITMIPDGKDVLGGFDVYIAVGNEDGAMSSITKKGQIIRVPTGAADALKKGPLVFNADLVMQSGEHVLSVGVIDRITSSSGFARAKIAAK